MSKKQSSPNRNGLSALQNDAIRLLASGCTAKYTALVLKLNYAQVRQWLKHDAQFQSALATQLERGQEPAPAAGERDDQQSVKQLPAADRRRTTIPSERG